MAKEANAIVAKMRAQAAAAAKKAQEAAAASANNDKAQSDGSSVTKVGVLAHAHETKAEV